MKMMKFIFAFLLFISINTHAQKFTPVDSASKIHFVIKNFGINTGGTLSGLTSAISFSSDDLAASHFAVSVAASTIATDNKMRDKSLADEEYFEAAKFPLLTIVSTKIEKTNKTATGFYEKLGYAVIGDEFIEVTLPHVVMEKNLLT